MERHGEAKFYWEDDLLIVEPKGPFNLEGSQYQCDEMQTAILEKDLKCWRRLEILEPNTLGSPDVLAVVKGLYHWYDQHGCYAAAVVVKNGVQRYAIETVFQGKNVSIFNNEEEARAWLDAQQRI